MLTQCQALCWASPSFVSFGLGTGTKREIFKVQASELCIDHTPFETQKPTVTWQTERDSPRSAP